MYDEQEEATAEVVATEEIDPVRGENQTGEMQKHWMKELDAARKERRSFNEVATKTLERYRNKCPEGQSSTNRYNLFFVNTDIKQSALYQRLPEPSIKRRFSDANDDVSRVAAMLLQRVTTTDLETNNFDLNFKNTIFNRLVPGFGVNWVRYQEEVLEEERIEQVAVTDPATGLPAIQQNVTPAVVDQLAIVDYVAWDDFMWSPCRVWTECRWVGRRVPMTKEQVKERFGATAPAGVIEDMTYSTSKTTDPNAAISRLYSKNQTLETADIYEIWDKDRKLVWFVCECSSLPLDVIEDTTRFPGFYPTPLPPLGRYATDSTLPISDYSEVSDLYVELDSLMARAGHLIDCIKNRFLYDAELADLATLFSLQENKGLPVKNYQTFLEKGGMAAAIQFTPLAPYVEALAQVMQQMDNVENKINRLEGMPDFMRGETQAYDSAAAIRQKGAFAPSRMGTEQKKIAEYIEGILQLVVHIVSRFYEDQTIIEHAGAMPEVDKRYFPAALKLIRADFQRNFRLKVSVDSLQDPNYSAERADRTAVVSALTTLLPQMVVAIKQTPQAKPLLIEIVRFAVAGMRGAEGIEGYLDGALQQAMQEPQQAAPQEPSKDELKLQGTINTNQTNLQIAQMETQTKQMVAASEAQSRQFNDQLEFRESQARTQIQAVEAQAKLIGAVNKQAIDVSRIGK